MRLIQKCGFMPVLIAFGIVSMLAAISMSMSLTNVMVLKKKVKMLNRSEGFYSNELAVWHQYLRGVEGLSGPNPDGSNPLIVDNEYVTNLKLTPDEYSSLEGHPLNVMTTLPFAPTTHLIRRYTAGSISYGTRGNCSATQFQGNKKRESLCLHLGTAKTKDRGKWLFGFLHSFCALVKSGSSEGVQCWGENADGRGNAGSGNNSARPTWVYSQINGDRLDSGIEDFHESKDLFVAKKGNRYIQFGVSVFENVYPDTIQGAGRLDVAHAYRFHGLQSDGHIIVISSTGFHGNEPESTWPWLGPPLMNGYFNGACFREIPGIDNAIKISTGPIYGCANLRSGEVKCWGGTGVGSSHHENYAPGIVEDLNEVHNLDVGNDVACAIQSESVWCWFLERILVATVGLTPLQALKIEGIPGVHTSVTHSDLNANKFCAIASNEIYCFEPDGFLKQFKPAERLNVPNLPPDIEFAAFGLESSCVTTKSDEVWCWGKGGRGQLGNGQFQDSATPVKVLPWAEK